MHFVQKCVCVVAHRERFDVRTIIGIEFSLFGAYFSRQLICKRSKNELYSVID